MPRLSSCEKQRRYRERHPEKFKEVLHRYAHKPWVCECGIETKNNYRNGHLKTKKHRDRMKIIEMQREIEALKEIQKSKE